MSLRKVTTGGVELATAFAVGLGAGSYAIYALREALRSQTQRCDTRATLGFSRVGPNRIVDAAAPNQKSIAPLSFDEVYAAPQQRQNAFYAAVRVPYFTIESSRSSPRVGTPQSARSEQYLKTSLGPR